MFGLKNKKTKKIFGNLLHNGRLTLTGRRMSFPRQFPLEVYQYEMFSHIHILYGITVVGIVDSFDIDTPGFNVVIYP